MHLISHALITLAINLKTLFCAFLMGSNQYWPGRVYDLYVYFLTGTPEGSTQSGFMEKPGIEPATPGLQDIGLSPPRQRLRNPFPCYGNKIHL